MKRAGGTISTEPNTGVRFTEWIVSAPSETKGDARAADWWRSPDTAPGGGLGSSSQDDSLRRPVRKGPRRLTDLAISVLASHVEQLRPEYLASVPPQYAWRLRKLLGQREKLHLGAWKQLLPFYASPDREVRTLGVFRFRQHICNPTGPLAIYTTPLTCLSFDFIAYLCIMNPHTLTARDLLSLPSLANLGVLQIIAPVGDGGLGPGQQPSTTRMSDAIVRGWLDGGDAIGTPFPVLRVLRVWGPESLTSNSLQWLSRLPSLAVVDIIGARSDLGNRNVNLAISQIGGWARVTLAEKQRLISTAHDLCDIGQALAEGGDAVFFERAGLRDRDAIGRRKRAEAGLEALLADSNLRIDTVPRDTAPTLHRVVGEGGPLIKPSGGSGGGSWAGCGSVVKSDSWAFWMHSLVGQLGADFDLRRVAVAHVGDGATATRNHILPSRPTVSLRLGHIGSSMYALEGMPRYAENRESHDTRRVVVVRRAWQRGAVGTSQPGAARSYTEGEGAEDSGRVSKTSRKRQKKMGDLLRSFQVG